MLTKEYERLDDSVEISEGVRLHYYDDKKFNTNVISIVWTAPAERENATATALLAETLRLGVNGDRKRLDERLADMYGAVLDSVVLQKGGRQLLALNMECVTDEAAGEKVFKHAVSLVREILDMKISENALKQAADRLRTSIAEKNDSAASYAVEKLIDMVYPGDGFSVHCGGYAEDLDRISAKELNNRFNQLRESAPTDIFISGSMGEEKAFEAAKAFMGRRGNTEKLPIDKICEAGGCAEKTENRSIGQSRIAAAYTSSLKPWGREWCIGLILREILCGSGSSALYDSVRQQEGLCYYIGGRLIRFRMVYIIDAGVAPGSEEKTIKLIDEGIKNIKIDSEKLEAAKKAVLRQLKGAEDRRMGIINERLNEMLLGVTVDHDAEKDLATISAADIYRAAEGLTKKGIFTVAASGDEVR